MPRMLFCGDTFLRTRDGSSPFAHVGAYFNHAAVCINLETSLEGVRQRMKNVPLCVRESALDCLPEEVQFVTIVNNHVADGAKPTELRNALLRRGKVVIGPANPASELVTVGGISVALFAAYFGLPKFRISYNGPRADILEKLILASSAERKIVCLHWGYERTRIPAPFQRHLAHRLLDAGADCIIGHHPHVPQGWEKHGGKAVYYSLGNFNFWQFDSEPAEENQCGYMVAYDVLTGASTPIPYRINECYQPYPYGLGGGERPVFRVQEIGNLAADPDDSEWFTAEYSRWYGHEVKVWLRRCFERPFSSLWIKWLAWLLVPMQLKYYWHLVRSMWIASTAKEANGPTAGDGEVSQTALPPKGKK